MNITQTRAQHNNIIDDIGKDLVLAIKQELIKGKPLRIIFDNMDFRILANIILKNNRNSDIHWIGHFVTFYRMKSDYLDDKTPLEPKAEIFDNGHYLC